MRAIVVVVALALVSLAWMSPMAERLEEEDDAAAEEAGIDQKEAGADDAAAPEPEKKEDAGEDSGPNDAGEIAPVEP